MNHVSVQRTKQLVLVGGGHAHVAVLKRFGMRPMPGARLVLISDMVHTPYSGMLPGLVAGYYNFDQTHLDLRKLARFAGADFCRARVQGLDLEARSVLCKDRPPIAYDLLSINIGSTPSLNAAPGASAHAIPVKPISRFLERLKKLESRISKHAHGEFRIVVVGGGAGGVELLLALERRLRERQSKRLSIRYCLVHSGEEILKGHSNRVRRAVHRRFHERGIQCVNGFEARVVEEDAIRDGRGGAIGFDALLWVTQASAQDWPKRSGLAVDEGGFIALKPTLQSVSHPEVFAAGDIVHVLEHPRPKSGVFAVRQGKPLAENLRRALRGLPPLPYRPQRRFLSLIGTGDRQAVLSRGPLAASGAWVWRYKDWIDKNWMRQYQRLPLMARPQTSPFNRSKQGNAPMPCGGCGAKVGGDVLAKVLSRIQAQQRAGSNAGLHRGLETPDDASVARWPKDKPLIQSVDFFRSLVNDPWLFGQIAAHHALNDLWAMGAKPSSALLTAVLPLDAPRVTEEILFQLVSGVVKVLGDHGAALIGGHTAEGIEFAAGLTVQGGPDGRGLFYKSGMRPGDRLILTKALGTGVAMAGDMRLESKGAWTEAAIESMLQSNRKAASIFKTAGARAATDVSGFGLAGHAWEMARASNVDVEIQLSKLTLLPGVLELLRQGVQSTMAPRNAVYRERLAVDALGSWKDVFPILFDPQTSGGLLAAAPETKAEDCLIMLKKNGYSQAAMIGVVRKVGEGLSVISNQ